MSEHQQAGESLAIIAKTYVLGVGGAAFMGITLQQWVLASALAVAVCQLAHWGWRFYTWVKTLRTTNTPRP